MINAPTRGWYKVYSQKHRLLTKLCDIHRDCEDATNIIAIEQGMIRNGF